MSQNDWTGLEGLKDSELVSQAYHEFNDLVHPPIFMELAKRLEQALDEIEYLNSVKDAVGSLDADQAKAVCETVWDSSIDTDEIIAIIKVCEDFDITTAALLRDELGELTEA